MSQPNDQWRRNCEILRLRQQGMSLCDLGKRYGLSGHRIDQIVHITQRKQGEMPWLEWKRTGELNH